MVENEPETLFVDTPEHYVCRLYCIQRLLSLKLNRQSRNLRFGVHCTDDAFADVDLLNRLTRWSNVTAWLAHRPQAARQGLGPFLSALASGLGSRPNNMLACLDLMAAERQGLLAKTRREWSLLMTEGLLDLLGFDRARRLAFYATGYRWTIKSGTPTFEAGQHTGELPGTLLRGTRT